MNKISETAANMTQQQDVKETMQEKFDKVLEPEERCSIFQVDNEQF